ncbi:MAG: ribosomal protein S18-alanine N-acetyltransferase [Acidaminococcaceae bacterium]|nr:ribosomal protein S18-alanine N-acetyltransferase [Acidaminococcaceae bacterium]
MGTTTKKSSKIRRMTAADIPLVITLTKDLFKDEWSQETWLTEVNNSISCYTVLELNEQIIGYAGYWLVAGEAQVVRVAVASKFQGQGLGDLLVADMIERAMDEGALAMSLEVRESNKPARKVYEKNGFVESGIRPNYYQDDHENAVIMWLQTEQG